MNNDAFSAESKVVVFDRSRSKHLEVQPMDFVLALEENVCGVKFMINNSNSEFHSGSLFVDGDWIKEGVSILTGANFLPQMLMSLSAYWSLLRRHPLKDENSSATKI